MKHVMWILAIGWLAVLGWSQKDQATTVSVVTQIKLKPEVAQLGERAEVNWTKGLIIAEGKGTAGEKLTMAQARLRARGAAIADAYRVLAAAVGGVRVDAETTIHNYELESDEVRTSIQALIRGAKVLNESLETLPDGSYIYTVRMGLSLYGPEGISRVVYPRLSSKQHEVVQPSSSGDASTPAEHTEATPSNSPESQPSTPQAKSERAAYTGLIVDATGFPLMPSMAPKILSTDGSEVFGTVKVGSQYANDVGIASFLKSLDAALMFRERVGDNPLVIRAKGGTKPYPTGVIVDSRDADLIRSENARSGFLDKFRVIIVSDKIF